MDVNMTAAVDGRGKFTMEALAQVWDALTAHGAPPEAQVQIQHGGATGRWVVTARWTPPEPVTDEAEVEIAPTPKPKVRWRERNMEAIPDEFEVRIPVEDARVIGQDADGIRVAGVLPEGWADKLQENMDRAFSIDVNQDNQLDVQAVAEAIQRRHRGLGYLNP